MSLRVTVCIFFVTIVFSWTNVLYINGTKEYDFFESINYENNIGSIQKKYTFSKDFPLLYKHNISQVVSTSNAFAIRLATCNEENFEYIQSLENRGQESEDDNFQILDPHRKQAYYIVFGHEDFGGSLSNSNLHLSQIDNLLQVEENTLNKNHIFIANDVCAQYNSFLALYKDELYCWGAANECEGK
jgi:hypothetical protein